MRWPLLLAAVGLCSDSLSITSIIRAQLRNGDPQRCRNDPRSRMTPVMEKAYIDILTIAQRTGYEILTVKIDKN